MNENHTPLAFVDTETTHLDSAVGEAWEVAVILREFDEDGHADTEYVWQFRPNLSVADPESLRIGKFEERFVVPPFAEAAYTEGQHTDYPYGIVTMQRAHAVQAVIDLLSGVVLIGSNPGFDDRFLRKLLGPGGAQWHYRPIDIATLVAGFMWAHEPALIARDPKPISSRWLSRQVGVEPPGDDAHQALVDARWARDVYDAVTGGDVR